MPTKKTANTKPVGRPKLFSSPQIMWDLFVRYKKYIKDNPILVQDFVGKFADEVYRKKEKPLTMVGFELFCFEEGYSDDLQNYFSNLNNAYKEFLTICSRIKASIQEDQISGGMAGIYNPSITQRLNGLTEKVDNKTDVTSGGKPLGFTEIEIVKPK